MQGLDFTTHWAGILALFIFAVAYVAVVFEDAIHMRKSKPVLIAAGLIWALIGVVYAGAGQSDLAHDHAIKIIGEYGELFLFLLVAITYVNALEERRMFEVLRVKLVAAGLTYRQLFLLTGALAFCLAGLLDNLTTALVMGAVVITIGKQSPGFVAIGCVSVVVAANAGGAFSPFGNITTLLVWQAGKVSLTEFFALFLPALVNWMIPAAIMYFAVPKDKPAMQVETVTGKPGMIGVAVLFGLTIATAVSFKNFLNLPPAMGMMLGLGYLQMWSYYLTRTGKRIDDTEMVLDSFTEIQRVEWDTLLFFFGIIFAVGGLGMLGYLGLMSDALYVGLGPTTANLIIGALSSIVDNIPLMYAVLTMDPDMSHGQWLLITLTTGVGGSILSIGSAAGVALMGQARGAYTFMSHLKWSWAITIGYAASAWLHLVLNARFF